MAPTIIWINVNLDPWRCVTLSDHNELNASQINGVSFLNVRWWHSLLFITIVKYIISWSFSFLASLGISIAYHESVQSGLSLGLRPANERRRYFVTTSLIGWTQANNQPRCSYSLEWSMQRKQILYCNDTLKYWKGPVATFHSRILPNVYYFNSMQSL